MSHLERIDYSMLQKEDSDLENIGISKQNNKSVKKSRPILDRLTNSQNNSFSSNNLIGNQKEVEFKLKSDSFLNEDEITFKKRNYNENDPYSFIIDNENVNLFSRDKDLRITPTRNTNNIEYENRVREIEIKMNNSKFYKDEEIKLIKPKHNLELDFSMIKEIHDENLSKIQENKFIANNYFIFRKLLLILNALILVSI